MPATHLLTVDAPTDRLDRFAAARLPHLTRSHIKLLIDSGLVTVDGKPGKPSQRLRPGQAVAVTIPDPTPSTLTPEDIPLHVAYEDADIIVVDKPAGLTVHPGPGHPSHTLVNAILARCPDLAAIKGSIRPGIVHRLDKDTSGLIVIAKNDDAHQDLQRQFKARDVKKTYLALALGHIAPAQSRIDAPIARDPRHRQRMAVVPGGRPSVTDYRVLEQLSAHCYVECRPLTGRTHQIRVHLATIGHPLLGDTLYGGRSPLLARQFLHAAALEFHQPRTGAPVRCKSPLPQDLAAVLSTLRAPRHTR